MMISAKNKTPVKVSVVLPVLNLSKYLSIAIQAILNQTFQDFELIIVADHSNHDILNLLSPMNHPKLQFLSQTYANLATALNHGFANANGEYWTWISPNNIVAPTWLQELMKVLETNTADIAFSSYDVLDENENTLFVNHDIRFDIPHLLMRYAGNASFLYRSKLAKVIGLYNSSLECVVDLDMWLRMAKITHAVHVESILCHCHFPANSTPTQIEKIKETIKKILDQYLNQTANLFDIEKMFPHIHLSLDPAFERWKARIWLVTLGINAPYCPIDALVDQLIKALDEHYQQGLVANIVHLFAKEERWHEAANMVAIYQQKEASDFLKKLTHIISQQDKNELQKIPFLTLDETLFSLDNQNSDSLKLILRNLSSSVSAMTGKISHDQPSLITT